MLKFVAIGDVHANWTEFWSALRAANCIDKNLQPTLPVCAGLYQIVIMGDLVHPKTVEHYERLTGLATFDHNNSDHLYIAASEQIKQLERLYAFQLAAPYAIHILLGNHDDAVLNETYLLSNSNGLEHREFDQKLGGVELPLHLRTWMQSFLRELRIEDVQFAHVSPLPSHRYYDDLFYADPNARVWFHSTPENVQRAGLNFGVYGHTQPGRGILVDLQARFAIIDALSERQYLEILLDPSQLDPIASLQVMPF
jgi:hypothetical protein